MRGLCRAREYALLQNFRSILVVGASDISYITGMSTLAAAFGWGFLASVSACAYPLLPLAASLRRASANYAMVIALTYGVAAAISGAAFAKYLGHPYLVTATGTALLYLGLGYARIVPLPRAVLENETKSTLATTLLGILSVFLIAPCTVPFLGNTLVASGKTGGAIELIAPFAFATGLALPFLLLRFIPAGVPKNETWRNALHYAAAAVSIAAGFHYLEDLAGDFPPIAQAFPFAVIGFAMCVTFYVLAEPMKREQPMPFRLKLNTAGMLMISGLGLFLFTSPFVKYWGAEVKNNTGAMPDSSRKVTMSLPQGKLKWYKDLAEAKTIAAKEGKILFIDFWADWCTACEEMEKKLFIKEEFINFALENKILPVRIDYSSPTDELDKLAQTYNIRGLPTVVLTKPDGELIHTLTGFYSKDYAMRELRSALKD